MTSLTPLDIFLIVSTVVVAIVGIYLVIILHRVTRATKVMDRVTMTAMKFQDAFAIVEKIPANIVHKVTDSLPSKKK